MIQVTPDTLLWAPNVPLTIALYKGQTGGFLAKWHGAYPQVEFTVVVPQNENEDSAGRKPR